MEKRDLLDLNIFTNCTEKYSDDASLIKNTYESIIKVFGDEHLGKVRIFMDPQPCGEKVHDYRVHIQEAISGLDGMFITDGLADGYIKSTEVCESDYIFQVEHDWEFLPTITHDLAFLVDCMKKENMHHLRFNKRNNIHAANERLTEVVVNGATFCRTTKRSNNPHIIDRKQYLEQWNRFIDLTNTPKRADGIENKMVGLTGYIYGPFNYPTQVHHTDGRA